MKTTYYNFIATATNFLENVNKTILKSENFQSDLEQTKIYLKNKLAAALKEKSKKQKTYKTKLTFDLE